MPGAEYGAGHKHRRTLEQQSCNGESALKIRRAEDHRRPPIEFADAYVPGRSRWLAFVRGNWSFVWTTIVLLAGLALLNDWPVLLGRIALPADLIVQFPVWERWRDGIVFSSRHAEIGDLVT